ncbi:MAG: ABC transporter ATP-binding protein [Coriobacteriaceae bacterium]|nr:ABC transporter ATP-binding protein [Coriobacteriaceae bacterium]MDD7111751.1 ABC transporter ATP-binding protein [Coriobacteriaceae bacterium]MDY5809873.1 ABC transporter ATP-binding protein [Coriobacteriales bacterium]
MSEHVLSVKDLKTYFHTATGIAKAVDGVSFTLDAGKTMGIVGESGSGKSVTASSIMRLLPQNGKIMGGEIDFDGVDMMKLSKKQLVALRGNEIAMIFQDPMTSLDPVFKVGNQMVEMICAHQNVSKEAARAMAIEALGRVGIPNPEKRMDAYPYELSGGMCQRVIIAMAICSHPKIIIADEPTTALDVTVQARVLELLRELQRNLNTGILLITHNLGVVWEMCDDVMVMYAGQTVEKAETKELYAAPLHPYTWGLLDSIPRLSDESKGMLTTIPGVPPDLRLTGECCNFCNRCRYAQDICRTSVPPLVEVKPNHFVACHLQNGTNKLERVITREVETVQTNREAE